MLCFRPKITVQRSGMFLEKKINLKVPDSSAKRDNCYESWCFLLCQMKSRLSTLDKFKDYVFLEDVAALRESLYSRKVGDLVSQKNPDCLMCVVCLLLLVPH